MSTRAQPCLCGSGKLYRKCCGKQEKSTTDPDMSKPSDRVRLQLSQMLQSAVELHKSGKIRRAGELYRQVLAIEPRHADAMHLLGLVERQLGNLQQAVELIRSAITINPQAAIFHNNLGEVYQAQGRSTEAELASRRALTLDPKLPEANLNLGHALRAQKRIDEALIAYRDAVRLRPGYFDALVGIADAHEDAGRLEEALVSFHDALAARPNDPFLLIRIGIHLRKMGRIEAAIFHYEDSIRRLPQLPELHNNVSVLYQRVGRIDDAIASLHRLLDLTPTDASARHILDALERRNTERAPEGYVRDIFDSYADAFEAHLVGKLGYCVPEQLAQVVKLLRPQGIAIESVLDMGCGTGLFGVAIAGVCQKLVGVDIAPKMVEKARQKGVYTELMVADILPYLQTCEVASYDLVAATDVFIYLGDLEVIFTETRRVLRAGGMFAFSVESTPDDEEDFVLDITGRYRQSSAYLHRLAEHCGMRSAYFAPAILRSQADCPVEGCLCVFVVPDE